MSKEKRELLNRLNRGQKLINAEKPGIRRTQLLEHKARLLVLLRDANAREAKGK